MKITRRTMLKAAAAGTAAIYAGKLSAAPAETVQFRGYARRGGIYAVPILAVHGGHADYSVTVANLDAIVAAFDGPVPLGLAGDDGLLEQRSFGEITAIFRVGNYLMANIENLGGNYAAVCRRLGVPCEDGKTLSGLIDWQKYRHCLTAEVFVSPPKLRRVVLLHPSDRPLWR